MQQAAIQLKRLGGVYTGEEYISTDLNLATTVFYQDLRAGKITDYLSNEFSPDHFHQMIEEALRLLAATTSIKNPRPFLTMAFNGGIGVATEIINDTRHQLIKIRQNIAALLHAQGTNLGGIILEADLSETSPQIAALLQTHQQEIFASFAAAYREHLLSCFGSMTLLGIPQDMRADSFFEQFSQRLGL